MVGSPDFPAFVIIVDTRTKQNIAAVDDSHPDDY